MKQRARKEEDKALRRQAIQEAAEGLFQQAAFAEVKMVAVAKAAGLAKGTVFLYFPTKEALFLELLQSRLQEWLDDLDVAMAQKPVPWTPKLLAKVVSDSLRPRLILTRLLILLTSVLEQNVALERVIDFKRWLLGRLTQSAEALELGLEGVPEGQGVPILLRVYALIIGIRQLADPGSMAKEALAQEDLAALAFDFHQELEFSIAAFVDGLLRKLGD